MERSLDPDTKFPLGNTSTIGEYSASMPLQTVAEMVADMVARHEIALEREQDFQNFGSVHTLSAIRQQRLRCKLARYKPDS